MTDLHVTDTASGTEKTYANADAAAYEAAFHDFAEPEDLRGLAKALDEGCLFESWSGKSSEAIELSRDPKGYWVRMCGLIETDNQIWEVR